MSRKHLLFVTGKLAEPALRRTAQQLSVQHDFDYSIAVLPITVAALSTTSWVANHLTISDDIDKIVLPGMCRGDIAVLAEKTTKEIEKGPKDLRDLPEYFGSAASDAHDYGRFDIEILAEINHASRLTWDELFSESCKLRDDGADLIDLGCTPGEEWENIGETVRRLREEGLRTSVDTFDRREVEKAVANGAELVLSVNSTNVEFAKDWGCEVVVIPDTPSDLESMTATVARLESHGIAYRVDPILEPIGFGFAKSLARYFETRRLLPHARMMMGVGNITELTDVDSVGVNVLLLAVCQELNVGSVLTTQVINWCRSCVRELDIARRLVYHACTKRSLPKHLTTDLLMLRDSKIREHGDKVLRELASKVTDRNFRVFAERGKLQVFNDKAFLEGTDPFVLFAKIMKQENIDPAHAFYLGYEMAKAVTAMTLGKNYTQDEALQWGFLTRDEQSHRHKQRNDSATEE